MGINKYFRKEESSSDLVISLGEISFKLKKVGSINKKKCSERKASKPCSLYLLVSTYLAVNM